MENSEAEDDERANYKALEYEKFANVPSKNDIDIYELAKAKVDAVHNQVEDKGRSYTQKGNYIDSVKSQPGMPDKAASGEVSVHMAVTVKGEVTDLCVAMKAVVRELTDKAMVSVTEKNSSKVTNMNVGKKSNDASRSRKERELLGFLLDNLDTTPVTNGGHRDADQLLEYLSLSKTLKNLRNKNDYYANEEDGNDNRKATDLSNVEKNKKRQNDLYDKIVIDLSSDASVIGYLMKHAESQSIESDLFIDSMSLNTLGGLGTYYFSAVLSRGNFSIDSKMGIDCPSQKLSCLIRKTICPKSGRSLEEDGLHIDQGPHQWPDAGKRAEPHPEGEDNMRLILVDKFLRALHPSPRPPDEAGPATHELITNDRLGAKAGPSVFPSDPDSEERGPQPEEAENPETSSALNEQVDEAGRDWTAGDGTSSHPNLQPDIGSDIGDPPRECSVDPHHHTSLKTLQYPLRVIHEVVDSSRSDHHPDTDLTTDAEPDSPPGRIPEDEARVSSQNSVERIQELMARALSPSVSEDSIPWDAEHGDLVSPPQSVRVHTPVAVSSPTCSRDTYYYEWDYSSTPVTSPSLGPSVPAYPQRVTGFTAISDTGRSSGHGAGLPVHRDSPSSISIMRRTVFTYQPVIVSSLHGSGDCHDIRSSPEGFQTPAPSSQIPLEHDSPGQAPASTRTDEAGAGCNRKGSDGHCQAVGASCVSSCPASPPPTSSRADKTRADDDDDDDHQHSAPERVPPVTVRPAGAVPPWFPRTALLDLSQAHNRGFAPLRVRKGTYDSDWPSGNGIGAAQMALAGFYRLGPGDPRVQCFYCGLLLDYLTSAHNIWDEHVRHCPTCPYLVFVMGEDLVRQTQENLRKQPE